MYKILNKVFEIGRHVKLSAVCINHPPTNGKDTRRILNEAHQFVDFPHSASGRIKYLLTDYLGLDKNKLGISDDRTPDGAVYKNYPQIYMLEHELGLLNNLDDD